MVDLMDLDNPTIVTLYGRSGTGKTTIAATAPKPLLLIDVKDKGTESAKGATLQRGDITVIELKHFDDIYDIHQYILDNPGKFKSVCIDHFTALQEFSHAKVMEEEGKTKMSQQMFGFSSSYLKEVIGLYKNLTDEGIFPIFLCQDRLEGGDGEGEDQLLPEVGPGIMPSVSRFLCAASRVVGHTYIQEEVKKLTEARVQRTIEYRLRLGPNPYYITKVTKSISHKCPAYIKDATFSNILEVIKGEWKDPTPRIKKKPRKS